LRTNQSMPLLCLIIVMLVFPVSGAPTITAYSNSLNGNLYPVVALNGNIAFTITTNETITTYTWFTDGVDQSNNFDNLTESWTEKGYKTVTVNATNANGTTETITWHPYVKAQMSTGADEVATVSEAGYDTLLDEMAVDNPDFEVVLFATTEPYTDIIGNAFFLILFGLPMTMLWIRQESMLMPSMFGLIMGTLLLAFLPASFATTAAAMIVLSLMGIVFMWAKERR